MRARAVVRAFYGCWWSLILVRVLYLFGAQINDYFLAALLTLWMIPGWWLFDAVVRTVTFYKSRRGWEKDFKKTIKGAR